MRRQTDDWCYGDTARMDLLQSSLETADAVAVRTFSNQANDVLERLWAESAALRRRSLAVRAECMEARARSRDHRTVRSAMATVARSR